MARHSGRTEICAASLNKIFLHKIPTHRGVRARSGRHSAHSGPVKLCSSLGKVIFLIRYLWANACVEGARARDHVFRLVVKYVTEATFKLISPTEERQQQQTNLLKSRNSRNAAANCPIRPAPPTNRPSIVGCLLNDFYESSARCSGLHFRENRGKAA